ncbi:MAG: threonine synthase [Oscillospiraceae bacterium]|nr:threonine synthase [Oscillospiraceae bacterium]
MYYKSTRDSSLQVTSAAAIAQGISADGGLFIPSEIPTITMDELKALADMSYAERANVVFGKFLTDFTPEEISYCTSNAYSTKNFETENIAELTEAFDNANILELWHGPTCAFKDMALQILPYLLTTSLKKNGEDKKVVILVATSGDTGKAALEGFKDVEGTEIMVFYPDHGVSSMQKRQMATQEGGNVGVCAIEGNFDDCQNGVKMIFTDNAVKEKLAKAGKMFSSANSINWGRLAPQIVYYVSAYAEMAKKGEIQFGDVINVVVPTGNFGNILAAYYAKNMGVPIGKLICASNINKVLTDFIETGVYNRNRDFYTTCSPSMDILISSNLERLLYILTGGDDAQIRDWFGKLSKEGRYEVTDEIKAKLQADFVGGFCDDAETKKTIHDFKEKYGYTCDTHTAVAVKVYLDYIAKTGDTTKTLIASTASPYKFSASVLEAIEGQTSNADEYEQVAHLAEVSGLPVPQSLADLKNKPVRFSEVITKETMESYVLKKLGIEA